MRTICVIGGGAAGFFAAITSAQENPTHRMILLERSPQVLAKVRISGGGRCNVTHACFDPAKLISFYPRGAKALRGPFSRFNPQHTVNWFVARGVTLKTEADGRMFPTTDNSQTIIDCLQSQARLTKVDVRLNSWIETIKRGDRFVLTFKSGEVLEADRVILATGSSPIGWQWAQDLGHTLEAPVPSLFTFTVHDSRLHGLSGISVPDATITLDGTSLQQSGPLLITHAGLSGPAVLKLSAWGARVFHEKGYKATLRINWLPKMPQEKLPDQLRYVRKSQALKVTPGNNPFELPRRLWEHLVVGAGINAGMKWTEVSNERLLKLAEELLNGRYLMNGKNPFKEEFVTAGGVPLDEVDFRTMESKRCPGLYFAGEVLDIDAVTGGFNFQNAWTTGWIAGISAGASAG